MNEDILKDPTHVQLKNKEMHIDVFNATDDKIFTFKFTNPIINVNSNFFSIENTTQNTWFSSETFIARDIEIPYRAVTRADSFLTNYWIEDLYKLHQKMLIVSNKDTKNPIYIFYGSQMSNLYASPGKIPNDIRVLKIDNRMLYLGNCSCIVITRKELQP